MSGSALDKNLALLLPKQLEAKDKDLQKNYENFKKNVTQKALLILQEVFPRKIEEFNSTHPIEAPPGVVINMDDFPEDDCYKVPGVEICDDSSPLLVDSAAEDAPKNLNGKRIRVQDRLLEEASAASGAASSVGASSEMPGRKINKVAAEGASSITTETSSAAESEAQKDARHMKLSEYIYTHRVPMNKKVAERVQCVKREAAELLELVATVKLWIQLNIPKIEDGNNFGVAIQEDVISELSRVEDAAFGLRESISKYFAFRAKLITKVVKYPNVEDYRTSLRELDEKQWFQMKILKMDTRNNYAIVYDMLHKNWQKVIKPRSTDGSMMVY